MAIKRKSVLKRPRRRSQKRNISSKKKGLLAAGLALLAIIILMVSVSRNQSSPEKNFFIKTVLNFTGDSQPCQAFHAWDLTLTHDQKIVVSDQIGSRILYFDQNGKFLREITEKKAGSPPFKEISGITSDDKGNVYVVDSWNGLVRGFSPDGKPTIRVELKNVYGPRGVAWDNGAFVVADTGTNRLLKVGTDGSILQIWGKLPSGKNLFDNPMAVEVDASGNFYEADEGNKRIQCLDPQGKFVRGYDMDAAPSKVTVDSKNGLVYASSPEGGFTKVFTVSGKYLGKLVDINQKDQPIKGINGLRVTQDGRLVAALEKEVRILQPIKE